ncbi:hypothetical protein [Lentibacillus sediminis]|uniref:hypothetical protein n=1 Tax=Lentibacillus sediminis TaxID=1940529 RepID=UPI000C1C13AB|nr:hypothetical protein [Lentibacillus sediminis]
MTENKQKSPEEKKKVRDGDKETSLSDFKEQQLNDEPPLEDMKIEMREEKKKDKSQDASQSERELDPKKKKGSP